MSTGSSAEGCPDKAGIPRTTASKLACYGGTYVDALLHKKFNVLFFSTIWFGYQLLLGKMFKKYENNLDLRTAELPSYLNSVTLGGIFGRVVTCPCHQGGTAR